MKLTAIPQAFTQARPYVKEACFRMTGRWRLAAEESLHAIDGAAREELRLVEEALTAAEAWCDHNTASEMAAAQTALDDALAALRVFQTQHEGAQ